ncbi:NUDIX hydrolase [Limnohabitans sp.]|uniref:NUDIX hydrolase n=1 Tax=Limnohabitans sp. TaxID=1907725 RepID=UPI00286F1398|nr:NUDIX hydrolase [Limnohabitans sp.]
MMQLNSEVVTSPARASATVILLRDTPQVGLEVFLLRRHAASAVLGGAYVFPGGKLDEADCAPSLHNHLDRTPQALHQSLGESDLDAHMAAGLYVAAVRESLEECGVLYARHADSQVLAHDALQRQGWQQQLHGGQGFEQVLQDAALRIDTQHLAPWSRWITPLMPSVTNKRFDTRFFVAALPAGQAPIHDNVEAVDSIWLTPRAALEKYWARELSLAPPQIMTLVSLQGYADAASVLRAAAQQQPPRVMPETFDADGLRHICYPGDPLHSVQQRAMMGPTRLRFIEGRFEPLGGLDTLLNP